jgi:hypothetical protein
LRQRHSGPRRCLTRLETIYKIMCVNISCRMLRSTVTSYTCLLDMQALLTRTLRDNHVGIAKQTSRFRSRTSLRFIYCRASSGEDLHRYFCKVKSAHVTDRGCHVRASGTAIAVRNEHRFVPVCRILKAVERSGNPAAAGGFERPRQRSTGPDVRDSAPAHTVRGVLARWVDNYHYFRYCFNRISDYTPI